MYRLAITLGVKHSGREVDCSSASSTEVKMYEAIPPLPHTSPWNGA